MNARADFPFFSAVDDVPVYLDNAATTQKPACVLDAVRNFYERTNANIHRGAHRLSREATDAHEAARSSVAQFLHAPSAREVLFTSGCTEGINLVAQTLVYSGLLKAGDDILVSSDAHHSNIVPWQILAERVGANLRPVPLTPDLHFDMQAFLSMLNRKTRMVAIPVVSNALGLRLPVEDITKAAHDAGALVLLDGAQSAAHEPTDVQTLGCDFFAFSGHKVYAPTGTGVLWGRQELLEMLPPWKTGGEMIHEVSFERTSFNQLPFKFEAGTPNICGDITLAVALNYIRHLGFSAIHAHEQSLISELCSGLGQLPHVQLLGGASARASLVSVHVPGVHHYDLGTLLDQMGIAVRTGHHCCQPLMQSLGITGTTRFSVAVYNHASDIERALQAFDKALSMLR